jgi:hypothetical protein
MKLRNKQTGDIYELNEFCLYDDKGIAKRPFLKSLAELNEEFEDYEEPKTYYYISDFGAIRERDVGKFVEDEIARKEIGNYFSSREEAELAVRKLKAWKRLKDKGFRLEGWTIDDGLRISICTNFDSDGIYDEDRKEAKKDLDICFGGEE